MIGSRLPFLQICSMTNSRAPSLVVIMHLFWRQRGLPSKKSSHRLKGHSSLHRREGRSLQYLPTSLTFLQSTAVSPHQSRIQMISWSSSPPSASGVWLIRWWSAGIYMRSQSSPLKRSICIVKNILCLKGINYYQYLTMNMNAIDIDH